MIISCQCGARLKISDDKLTDAGVKIKCPKCGTAHVAKRTEQPVRTTAVTPPAAFAPEVRSPSSSAEISREAQRNSPLVLVAHDSKVVADMIDGVLRNTGIVTAHAANGLEALKMATELKPQAMVVDVGLTGIYGFELCERLKGDPSTSGIKIILLSSVYGLTAYKRAPVNLYGADDYIEKHHIPDDLVPKLRSLLGAGLESGSVSAVASPRDNVAATAETASVQAARPAPVDEEPAKERDRPSPQSKTVELPEIPSVLPKTPVTLSTARTSSRSVTASKSSAPSVTPSSEPAIPRRESPLSVPGNVSERRSESRAVSDASVKLDASFFEQEEYIPPAAAQAQPVADPAEIEKAKRFARIIVSDIALYNQEAVAEGIRSGTFYELLKDDITEGRSVYDQRVPESIRRTGDYLQEAFDDFIASKQKLR